MTTIALNKTSMACDLQATKGYLKFKTASKIIVLEKEKAQELFGVDRALIGHAGRANDFGKVMVYLFTEKAKPPRLTDSEFVMLSKDGIYHTDDFTTWNRVDQPYFAIGSGAAWAAGALASGKSPLDSCKIAGKHDIYTGIGYKEYML